MIDRSSPEFTARMDQQIAALRETVAERGHIIMNVHSGFAHTVGLTEFGKPELVFTNSGGLLTLLLDEIAESYRLGLREVTEPTMKWHSTDTDSVHTYTVSPYNARDPHMPLGFAVALYGHRVRALRIDPLSCTCAFCQHKVVVDDDGNYLGTM